MPLQSTCDHCGTTYSHAYTYRASRFCSRRCSSLWAALHQVPLPQRFWAKVVQGAGCWDWTGCRNAKGYGKIGRWRAGMDYAHRVAYELASGETLTSQDEIGHTCDRPSCVRNDDQGTYEVRGILLPRWGHLFRGTHADNVADAAQKGRNARGEMQASAKLTDAQIHEICARYKEGALQAAIALEFDISRSYVSEIVNGRRRAQAVASTLAGGLSSDGQRVGSAPIE